MSSRAAKVTRSWAEAQQDLEKECRDHDDLGRRLVREEGGGSDESSSVVGRRGQARGGEGEVDRCTNEGDDGCAGEKKSPKVRGTIIS